MCSLIKMPGSITMNEETMTKIKHKLAALLRSGPGTRLLLILFAALVLSVVYVGLQDTPGYILGYLATAVLFLLLVRRWRSVWSFVGLMVGAFVGGILLSGLYVEIISRIAVMFWGPGATDSAPMRVIEVIITNIVLFGGPTGLVFGFGGALVTGIWRIARLRSRPGVADRT